MKDLAPRILGAIVYGVLMLVAASIGGYWLMGIFSVLALLLSYELLRMQAKKSRFQQIIFLTLPVICIILPQLNLIHVHQWIILLIGCILWCIISYYRITLTAHSDLGILASMVYIGIPLGALVVFSHALSQSGFDGFYLLLLYYLIWSSDIMAFFVGRTIGKTPLAPRISPKKTAEGSIGGILLPLLFLPLVIRSLGHSWDINYLWIGLITIAVGIWGDLFESQLKRTAQIKDSGHLLPGHGGFLDRMDSILFAIPIYILLSEILLV